MLRYFELLSGKDAAEETHISPFGRFPSNNIETIRTSSSPHGLAPLARPPLAVKSLGESGGVVTPLTEEEEEEEARDRRRGRL